MTKTPKFNPTDNFMREAEILKMTRLSRTTRWRLERSGKFPRRYQISDGITAYKQSEIQEWMDNCPCEVSHG